MSSVLPSFRVSICIESEQKSAAMFDFKRGGLGTSACEHLQTADLPEYV